MRAETLVRFENDKLAQAEARWIRLLKQDQIPWSDQRKHTPAGQLERHPVTFLRQFDQQVPSR